MVLRIPNRWRSLLPPFRYRHRRLLRSRLGGTNPNEVSLGRVRTGTYALQVISDRPHRQDIADINNLALCRDFVKNPAKKSVSR